MLPYCSFYPISSTIGSSIHSKTSWQIQVWKATKIIISNTNTFFAGPEEPSQIPLPVIQETNDPIEVPNLDEPMDDVIRIVDAIWDP